MESKNNQIIWLSLVLFMVLCNAGEKGKYVIEIETEKSFQEFIQDPTNVFLIEFYDPICGSCKNFAPEYAKIGAYLRGITKVGRFSIQPQDHKPLVAQYKVLAVPYVTLFLPGDPIPKPFTGPARTPAAITRWVISQLDPVFHLEGSQAIAKYFGEGEEGGEQEEVFPSRFLLLHEGEGEALDAFRALAGNKRGEAVFAEVGVGGRVEEIPKGINVTTYPALVVRKGLHGQGPRYVVYERDWQDSLKEFWEDIDAQVLATLLNRQPMISLPMFTLLFFVVIVCVGLFIYFKKKNLVRNVGELTSVSWDSKVD